MSKISTQFEVCHLPKNTGFIKEEIHSGYKFSCLKAMNDGVNPFVVYKTYNGGVSEVYREESYGKQSVKNFMVIIGRDNEPTITNKLLITGCHTVVNLKNRLKIGDEPLEALKFSLDLIERIKLTKNVVADFMIPLNDFFMEHDPSTISNQADNKYRKEAVSNYILPTKATDILASHNNRTGMNIIPLYCSEKGMADRFNRYIKNKKNNSDLFISSDLGRDWSMVCDGELIPIIKNSKPNCVAGNAATERAIRYNITSNKMTDHYTSRVGIYPRCSMKNVLDGYRVACKSYGDFDIPGYFVFFGGSCA